MFVPFLIKRGAKKDIVLDGKVLESWILSSVGEAMHETILVNLAGIFGESSSPSSLVISPRSAI